MSAGTSSAPRGAIPNWHPATTAEDYLRNCREGLEEYSERRFAKLLGWPRMRVHRAKLMAEIPGPLFERLLAARILSSKALAAIALAAWRPRQASRDIERCPHCGGVLRIREHVTEAARGAIRAWIDDGEPS